MKTHFLFILILLLFNYIATAQKIEILQPEQTLVLQSDTVYWEIPELKIADYYLFSEMESPRTTNNDVEQGQSFTYVLRNGKNAVRCPSPGEEKTIFSIKIKKEDQTKEERVIFWILQRIDFDSQYIQANRGKAKTEIPEVFELTNIVFALTQRGRVDSNMIDMTSGYYQEVMKYFKPFEQHPLIKKINQLMLEDTYPYLNYRMDSYGYILQQNKLISSRQYKNLGYRQHLSDDAALWEDFIEQSKFRDFYRQHAPHYQALIHEAERLLTTKRMWQWLEERFPNKYNSYRIILSPLINGSHNTERYENNGFKECLMFVRDARRYDQRKYSNSVISGLYTGIVFTEIDHNYVNPVSDTFKDRIDPVFKDRKKWTSGQGDAEGYQSAYAVFNEYLTHSVYLIYVKDFYPPEEYKIIKENRVKLMNRRGFIRFAAFHEALLKLYEQQGKKDLAALYPLILEWSSKVQ